VIGGLKVNIKQELVELEEKAEDLFGEKAFDLIKKLGFFTLLLFFGLKVYAFFKEQFE